MNALRKLKRQVAKTRMKKNGIRHMCKKTVKNRNLDSSYFSTHWKEVI